MTKIPPLTGFECVRKLKKLGFKLLRQTGSHVVLMHDDQRMAVVPCHKGKDLGRGLIQSIIKDAQVSPEEFNKL